MTGKEYILSIDQGTTASTALLVDAEGQIVTSTSKEVGKIFPRPGWVEQDPQEMLDSALAVIRETLRKAGVPASRVKCLGITNQRETTVVWDRHTGKPVTNAIGWQCRRTASICEELKQKDMEKPVREKTGLIIDAYFSATKIRWILDNIPDGQERARKGDLLFGTVDTWLIWNLTGGKTHVTDYSNASRTMLYNIRNLRWDTELLEILDIPESMLPRVMPSSMIYGETEERYIENTSIPVGAIAGDQQAALFGQACYDTGMVKNTYGTGSFVLLNTGGKPVVSEKGLVTTLAWGLGNEVTYAMEGSIFVTGAAVQWLRDGLGIISNAAETGLMAESVPDTGGVYFVPSFVGLGAPYWDMYARGTMVGLTQGTTGNHIVRATLEAITYQSKDVIEAMGTEAGLGISVLRVDGGGTANKFMMQFQADILDIPIQVAKIAETTALGAAYLAGLAAGYWKNTDEISRKWQAEVVYEPGMSEDQRDTLYSGWKRAVERASGWITE